MSDQISSENGSEHSAGVAGSRQTFRPLRVWPAVLFALLIPALRYGPGLTENPSEHWMWSVFGPLLCCLLLLIWWLAFSRATWRERVFGLLALVVGNVVTFSLAHPTMRGAATSYFTLPLGFFIFAFAATMLRNSAPARRSAVAVLLAIAGFAVSDFMRADGMTGEYNFAFGPRWKQSAEEAMLAEQKPSAGASAPQAAPKVDSASQSNALAHPEWPEFRGPDRAARSLAPKIATDWSAHGPQQLWKISVGPGWSSFAVAGHMLFTQEQRGPKETVVCYDADSGKESWKEEIDARLEDPMGGPGPRATPTLANGALYATGSTGVFLRLNPLTGAVVWKKDLTQVASSKLPMWGFASSPLVVGPVVIVCGGDSEEKGLLAFATDTGELRWSAPCPINSYSSPQRDNLLGEDSVVMLSSSGLEVLDPATGKLRLHYEWKIPQYRALQPSIVAKDTILLPTGMNMGTRAIHLKKTGDQYGSDDLWTSLKIKPDFSDLVTYQGYAYGNDAGMLTCIDLQTGERKWKEGRYGKGQILLLENSGLLLILSEQGKVVLVPADPNGHREIASFQALEGKTWNHPVLVGDRLYVRNSQQAAAYKIPLAQ
jgi:outer membrane protein assembly factor BamB